MKASIMNPYVAPGILIVTKALPEIARILLHELDTNLDTMCAKTRKREVVSKRQAMIYLLNWYGFGYSELGRFFLHNHATMIHSVRTVENDMLTNNQLKDFIRKMQLTKLKKN